MLCTLKIKITLHYIIHFKCVGFSGGKSQKAYEEGQAQLTHYKPLTQETDSLQPSLASVTDNDGHQSVSQSARLSTGSVDSAVGRSSSHNSYSKLSHQDDTGELASPAAQYIPAHNRGNTTISMCLRPAQMKTFRKNTIISLSL